MRKLVKCKTFLKNQQTSLRLAPTPPYDLTLTPCTLILSKQIANDTLNLRFSAVGFAVRPHIRGGTKQIAAL